VVGGGVASLLLTPCARLLANRLGIIDRPVGDKIHKIATPLMGGVAVYVAFAIAVLLFLPLSGPVRGVLAGGLAATGIGVLDERFNLPPLVHLAGQVSAAVVAIALGVGVVRTVSIPTAGLASPGFQLPLVLGAAFTLFWIVAMMNTMNFLDGLDGLAAGVAAIAALLLAVWAVEKQRLQIPITAHHEDLILPLALTGALLGFLPYNWHRARIFMGDSGSMFLGLALATLSIVGPAKLGTAIVVLMIPVLDVAWAIVRRQFRGRSFLSGDKQHVYHRMMDLGLSHLTTVLLLYMLVAALAGIDLVLIKTWKLVAAVVLALAIGGVFISLEIRASRRRELTAPEGARNA
jgi:UDP-GlcNAc:undecaprenyl-phosphate GlcNAc-1-phosphate transferase